MLLLWLIIGSLLWCISMCPPVHKHGQNGALAVKKSGGLRHQVRMKYRRVLQTEIAASTKKGPRQDEEEDVSTTTANPNVTKLYWNVTHERCDYDRIRCMRAYATGAVCARTLYYQYYSFPNYCVLEYHNCIGRYEGIWTIAYMGICTEIDIEKELYVVLAYDQMANTSFLTQMYIEDSGDLTIVG